MFCSVFVECISIDAYTVIAGVAIKITKIGFYMVKLI